MNCKAKQYSDQYVCDQCGLVWDMNDPEPPRCLSVHEKEMAKMRKIMADNPPRRVPPDERFKPRYLYYENKQG